MKKVYEWKLGKYDRSVRLHRSSIKPMVPITLDTNSRVPNNPPGDIFLSNTENCPVLSNGLHVCKSCRSLSNHPGTVIRYRRVTAAAEPIFHANTRWGQQQQQGWIHPKMPRKSVTKSPTAIKINPRTMVRTDLMTSMTVKRLSIFHVLGFSSQQWPLNNSEDKWGFINLNKVPQTEKNSLHS